MLRWLVRLVRVPAPDDAGDTLVELAEVDAAGPLQPRLNVVVAELPPEFEAQALPHARAA